MDDDGGFSGCGWQRADGDEGCGGDDGQRLWHILVLGFGREGDGEGE